MVILHRPGQWLDNTTLEWMKNENLKHICKRLFPFSALLGGFSFDVFPKSCK
jgi:hypothetical protein